ncbi:AT-hook motif nuclear-localized protein 1 [Abeliophyllum distichum]|uniref:AT-hook motif nuclear-localized protein n=1 Tax=Abeliophyllum distichum TaxID=126358 RepID=A0ABD1TFD2_9LAMI
MESRERISGVTVISPEAPSSYHVAPRTENSTTVTGIQHMTPYVASAGLSATSEKKKRGRPRKYGPDGSARMVLSPTPISSSAPPASGNFYVEKPCVVRPTVSEKKHKNKVGTEKLGEWVSCFTGGSFLPHIITVDAGEDVSNKIMSFSLEGPRAICIISAVGLISNVTLRQPNSPGNTLTYEGRFEILSMSGSFTPFEMEDSRSGIMSTSLASPDGRVVGGLIAGLMIAASPVRVIVGSFLPSGHPELNPKKPKAEPTPNISASIPVGIPHSSNVENKCFNTGNIAPQSTVQTNNWAAVPTAENSSKSTADINISLQG